MKLVRLEAGAGVLRGPEEKNKVFVDFFGEYGILELWGISAVGSVPHWQCGGHGFESRMLHA